MPRTSTIVIGDALCEVDGTGTVDLSRVLPQGSMLAMTCKVCAGDARAVRAATIRATTAAANTELAMRVFPTDRTVLEVTPTLSPAVRESVVEAEGVAGRAPPPLEGPAAFFVPLMPSVVSTPCKGRKRWRSIRGGATDDPLEASDTFPAPMPHAVTLSDCEQVDVNMYTKAETFAGALRARKGLQRARRPRRTSDGAALSTEDALLQAFCGCLRASTRCHLNVRPDQYFSTAPLAGVPLTAPAASGDLRAPAMHLSISPSDSLRTDVWGAVDDVEVQAMQPVSAKPRRVSMFNYFLSECRARGDGSLAQPAAARMRWAAMSEAEKKVYRTRAALISARLSSNSTCTSQTN